MDVMDAGRMAVFADPLGAVIGLWQPNQHTGAQVANEPGTYCWSELITTDLDASKAFYGAVFGWDAEDQGPPGGPPAYTEWKLGGKSIGGMMLKKSPDMPAEMPPVGRLLRRGRHRRHGGPGPGARRHACSWARPTSSRAASPCWPTTSAPSSTSWQLKG
jgi:predicted enzyme related to lactoylglutathione lyase